MGFEAIIFILIFVGVVLIVEGLYLVTFGKSISTNSRVNRRLALLEQGKDHEDVLQTLRKERDQHRFALQLPIISLLTKKAAQANLAFTPQQLIGIMFGVTVFSFFMFMIFRAEGFVTNVVLAFVFGFGGVYFWLARKAKKRISLFEEQLPDAVDLVVRSLRVGHPFTSAINVVATEMADPMGTEFGIISDEATYGLDVHSALGEMAERIDLQDVRFLAVAVGIQARSGGNLAEILDGLSKVIRARFKLFRRVRAITAEAKFSGWFLSLFPIGAILVVQLVKPDYYDAVRETEFFVPACLIVAAFLVVNIIVMRAMVNIRV